MTDKTKIDWCDMSWNPVTGCLHDCPYCYAKRVTNRFGAHLTPLSGKQTAILEKPDYFMQGNVKVRSSPFPFDFLPTFHRYRLEEPARKTKPRNIFVCSMADLFGRWVPVEWIVEVLDACRAAPQHNFLFLTKNPARYEELDKLALLPREDNFWYGSTVTAPGMPFFHSEFHKTFLSIEPLLEPFGESEYSSRLTDWAIIGAETGNRKEKVTPKREWVVELVQSFQLANVPVFMKSNLSDVWGVPLLQEYPEGLRRELPKEGAN